MSDVSDLLLDAMRLARPETRPETRLAVVTQIAAAGARVRFDGETSAGTRYYLLGCSVAVDDRVLMTRAGTTWVVSQVVSPFPPDLAAWGVVGSQGITHAAWTQVSSLTEVGRIGPASAGLVWVGGTSDWRVDHPGVYHIEWGWGFQNADRGGNRFGGVTINGSRRRVQGYDVPSVGHHKGGFLSCHLRIAYQERIGFQVYQDGQTTLNLDGLSTGSEYRSWWSIRRIAS